LDGFVELAEKYGLETAAIIAVLVFHYWLIFWLIRQVIKSKDAENRETCVKQKRTSESSVAYY
jgi:hypothetical protein